MFIDFEGVCRYPRFISFDHIKSIRRLVNNGTGGSLSLIVNIRTYFYVVSLVQ